MTRILYLPTAEYLMFKCSYNSDSRTPIFEHLDIAQYPTVAQNYTKPVLDIIVLLANTKSSDHYSLNKFSKFNKITLPAIPEHFEIIEPDEDI